MTTSPGHEWVTSSPAAFLGCGSRFSGSPLQNKTLIPHSHMVTMVGTATTIKS